VDRIVEFLFEVGMLKRTPRSGWQFLGTGSESVAEHVYRTTMIAFVLGRLDGAVDADKVLRLALAHDLPEARTGDLNYVNQKYVTADEAGAADDMTRGLPFGEELKELMAEYRDASSSRRSWTQAAIPPMTGRRSCSGDCGPTRPEIWPKKSSREIPLRGGSTATRNGGSVGAKVNPHVSPAFCCGRRCTAPSGVFSPRGALPADNSAEWPRARPQASPSDTRWWR